MNGLDKFLSEVGSKEERFNLPMEKLLLFVNNKEDSRQESNERKRILNVDAVEIVSGSITETEIVNRMLFLIELSDCSVLDLKKFPFGLKVELTIGKESIIHSPNAQKKDLLIFRKSQRNILF